MYNSMLTSLKKLQAAFFLQLNHFSFPIVMCYVSSFSTSLPIRVRFHVFLNFVCFRHPRLEVVVNCYFDLCFLNN